MEGPADLYLTGDTDSFTLIVYDRVSLDENIASGRFTAEGDLELVAEFDRWLTN